MTEAELVGAIKTCLGGPPSPIREARDPRPPVTVEEWATFEARVGRPLPSLLRRAYVEIGDGGWCPLGVRGEEDEPWFSVLGLWEGRSEDGSPLLRFCDGGCTVFSVLDLASGRGGLEDDHMFWQADSLHIWFERWLAGEQVMSFGDSA